MLSSLFLAAAAGALASADLMVLDRQSGTKMRIFRDAQSSFGAGIPEDGLTGRLMQAEPLTACHALVPAPVSRGPKDRYFALIARYGGCNFEEKVRAATEANYSAAVVFNVNSDKLVPMGGDDADSLIPSVFIGYSDAEDILRLYTYPYNDRVLFFLSGDEPFDLNSYLLPFAIVVGICFLVMLGIVMFKCVQDRRRRYRHRLPKSQLKRLPIVKYRTGDQYSNCVVCMDDYEEGDKVRVLPCNHTYHPRCIDPWLVKTKRICPQCRKRVFPEEEEEDAATTTDERAPLLGSASSRSGSSRSVGGSSSGGGGTFAPQNPTVVRGGRNRSPSPSSTVVSNHEVVVHASVESEPSSSPVARSPSGSSSSAAAAAAAAMAAEMVEVVQNALSSEPVSHSAAEASPEGASSEKVDGALLPDVVVTSSSLVTAEVNEEV